MKKHVASVHEGKKPSKCDYRNATKQKTNRHFASVNGGKIPKG
jgi:hypothetical protein